MVNKTNAIVDCSWEVKVKDGKFYTDDDTPVPASELAQMLEDEIKYAVNGYYRIVLINEPSYQVIVNGYDEYPDDRNPGEAMDKLLESLVDLTNELKKREKKDE